MWHIRNMYCITSNCLIKNALSAAWTLWSTALAISCFCSSAISSSIRVCVGISSCQMKPFWINCTNLYCPRTASFDASHYRHLQPSPPYVAARTISVNITALDNKCHLVSCSRSLFISTLIPSDSAKSAGSTDTPDKHPCRPWIISVETAALQSSLAKFCLSIDNVIELPMR